MRARLPISASRFSSALAPAETPITRMRPPVASACRFSGMLGAPTSSRITSNGPCSAKPSQRDRLGAERGTCSRSSSRRTVAVTRAPAARASWIAAVPTPPAPPCTSRCSPGRSPAWVKSASWAVVNTSGSPPAAGQSSAAGTGISTRSCTTASSACAPPPTIAITRSPTAKRSAPGAEGRDLTRELHAGDVLRRAGRRRIEPAALHHVGAVQSRRAHAHEHLSGARLRVGVLLDHDLLLTDGGGAHRKVIARAASGSARRPRPLEQRDALDVVRLREHVHRAHLAQRPARPRRVRPRWARAWWGCRRRTRSAWARPR